MNDIPHMAYSDAGGNLFTHPFYLMAVFDGEHVRLPMPDELLEVPPGSDLFMLEGRYPIGINPETEGPEVFRGGTAVSAFLSPSYLRLCHPAYQKGEEDCPVLPLYAYAPLGILNRRMFTTAIRVDRSRRQDPRRFNLTKIKECARKIKRKFRKNRLVNHLVNCAIVYGCRAAQNFFLGREEAPLPTSPTCNALCLGCLSHQPDSMIPASHNRISFCPTPEEIAEVALFHINRVRKPVVSFGQGCEGEPLMVHKTLVEAIRLIRKETDRGTINLNTNGSNPSAVEEMVVAGLDSIRLTVNSFRPEAFRSYVKPRGFSVEDTILSGKIVKRYGGFVSVNLLVFPGVTDTMEDLLATVRGLEECRADMVQMRNLNIDPEIYLAAVGKSKENPFGLIRFMEMLKEKLPYIRFGYFNPPVRSLIRKRRARAKWQ